MVFGADGLAIRFEVAIVAHAEPVARFFLAMLAFNETSAPGFHKESMSLEGSPFFFFDLALAFLRTYMYALLLLNFSSMRNKTYAK